MRNFPQQRSNLIHNMPVHMKTIKKSTCGKHPHLVKILPRSAFYVVLMAFNIGMFAILTADAVTTSGFTPFIESVEAKTAEVNFVREELSPKEYLLSEVEKAGLDKYKVYQMFADSECGENPKFDPQARYINYDNRAGVDRGMFQLSDKFHPEVSNECAYDLKCNVKEGIRILKEKGFKEWTCGRLLKLK